MLCCVFAVERVRPGPHPHLGQVLGLALQAAHVVVGAVADVLPVAAAHHTRRLPGLGPPLALPERLHRFLLLFILLILVSTVMIINFS